LLAPFLGDREIIGPLVGPTVLNPGQDVALARFHIDLADTPPAEIIAFGDDESLFDIEFRPGCLPAWRAKNGCLSGLWVQSPDVPSPRVLARRILAQWGKRDIAEINHAV